MRLDSRQLVQISPEMKIGERWMLLLMCVSIATLAVNKHVEGGTRGVK